MVIKESELRDLFGFSRKKMDILRKKGILNCEETRQGVPRHYSIEDVYKLLNIKMIEMTGEFEVRNVSYEDLNRSLYIHQRRIELIEMLIRFRDYVKKHESEIFKQKHIMESFGDKYIEEHHIHVSLDLEECFVRFLFIYFFIDDFCTSKLTDNERKESVRRTIKALTYIRGSEKDIRDVMLDLKNSTMTEKELACYIKDNLDEIKKEMDDWKLLMKVTKDDIREMKLPGNRELLSTQIRLINDFTEYIFGYAYDEKSIITFAINICGVAKNYK